MEYNENQELYKAEEIQDTEENRDNKNNDTDLERNESKERNGNQESNGGEEKDSESKASQDDEGKKDTNYSVNMAIVGGVLGAGIGLLANRETSRRIVKNLSESELVKAAGDEFKKTAQELLAGQAQDSMKKVASGYINKFEEGLLNTKRGGDGADKERYEEIKQENKQLNDRLDKIEQMLSNLVESK